ncbi:MAG: hypothetical protein ACLS3M_12630 [Collinsella sp.]
MVSRYLDRIASISIDAACRLTFLLTGQRMTAGDIACTDEDELESMRVPSGEGVIMRPAVDARYVAKVPVNEVSEGLRYCSIILRMRTMRGRRGVSAPFVERL